MTPVQESSDAFPPAKPRSSSYYAAGALVHLGVAGALTALGSRWSGVPLFAAGTFAVLAARARRRRGHSWRSATSGSTDSARRAGT
jgi:hypothetical protein